MNVITQVTHASVSLVLSNAMIVLRDMVISGSLSVEKGVIQSIDEGNSRAPGAIDCEGDYVIPGLIDLHTDNLEKHLEPRPGVRWPTLAALQAHDRMMATAGVTTVFDSLVAGEMTFGKAGRENALKNALEALQIAKDGDMMKSEHLFHVRCELPSETLLEELDSFLGHPLVQLASLMDHTPGQRQWSDLKHWKEYKSRTHSESELDAQLDDLLARQARHSEVNRMEVRERCRSRGIPLASHDDTTVEHVRQAFESGVLISEFPTTEAAAQEARDLGMKTIMGAPNIVKGGSHSGNVGAGYLAELKLLDGVSSDYVPVSMIQSVFLLEADHGMTLPEAVNTGSLNPAGMAGLTDRGEIAAGKRADLVRVRKHGHIPIVRSVWREGRPLA